MTVTVDPEVATAIAVIAQLHGLTRGETLRKITLEWLRAQAAAPPRAVPHEPSAAERTQLITERTKTP